MTTTEHAAEIRKALKAKGWTSRDVSVKSSYFANGSSIDIRIKNPLCAIATVKKIAEPSESIRRDEYSGEILSGGNRYLSISYTSGAMMVLRDKWLPRVKAAFDAITPGTNALERIGETEFLIGRPDSSTVTIWDRGAGCLGKAWRVEDAAEHIATLAVARAIV